MRIKRNDWIFIAIAGGVIGTLVVLSMIGREAKPIAAIPEHTGITRETRRVDCLVCHDPGREGAPAPLPVNHPHVWKKEAVSCTTCHLAPASNTATTQHPPFKTGQ